MMQSIRPPMADLTIDEAKILIVVIEPDLALSLEFRRLDLEAYFLGLHKVELKLFFLGLAEVSEIKFSIFAESDCVDDVGFNIRVQNLILLQVTKNRILEDQSQVVKVIPEGHPHACKHFILVIIPGNEILDVIRL